MLGCVVVRDLEDSNSSIEPFPTDRNDSDCGWRRGGGGGGRVDLRFISPRKTKLSFLLLQSPGFGNGEKGQYETI